MLSLDEFEGYSREETERFVEETIKNAEKNGHDHIGFHIRIVKKILAVMKGDGNR